jgi:tetratricopeptide (TPR) repeat protein
MASRLTSAVKLKPALKRLGVAITLAAAAAGAFAAGKKAPATVQDPHYGDTLFHFYQERYFTAITGLMVSQHFDRVGKHADEAELLRGGMLLSYGMHREAGEIFAQLIERGAAPSVRDRAWYFLAKIRYQRGLHTEAADALSRIEKNLPPELEEDRVLVGANVLMALGDYAGAATALNAVPGIQKDISEGTPSAHLYARYNLGVALVRNGDAGRGAALLDQIGKAPTPSLATEEFRSLRDKANVALGFAMLKSDKPDAAGPYLERVRLNGPQSNKALLGFGWASASIKNHKQALVPWTELAERDASDSAVLEATIALPYAYGQLGALGQALERYNAAIALFERENAGLDESIAAIRSGKLVQGLLDENPGEEMGWFWNIRSLPQMPHAGHLTQVLSQHDFQEAFKNFRDLQFLSRNLQRWKDNLGVFNDMLDNRRKAYAERLPSVLAKASESGMKDLAQRIGALATEIAEAEAKGDGEAFADAKERELIELIDGAKAALQNAGNDPESVAARERLRLVSGAMVWRLAQAYPQRVYDARRDLQTLEAGVAEAQGREVRLQQAQRDEPAKFDRFGERIVDLGKRVDVLIPQVVALSQEQQAALQELAVAELVRQKERLAAYSVQARFAVAQLYDRATKAKEGGDAAN